MAFAPENGLTEVAFPVSWAVSFLQIPGYWCPSRIGSRRELIVTAALVVDCRQVQFAQMTLRDWMANTVAPCLVSLGPPLLVLVCQAALRYFYCAQKKRMTWTLSEYR